MNNKIKQKKYFVKDEELNYIEDDKLNHKDIVKNLNLIIENTQPSYNIALIGKWGTGKSSILNMLLNKYEKDTENYIVQKLNVWENKKENLKRVFEKQLYKSLNKDNLNSNENYKDLYNYSINEFDYYDENITEYNYHQLNNNTINNIRIPNYKKQKNIFNNIIFKFTGIFLLILLITIIIFTVSEYLQNINVFNSNPLFFVQNTFFNFCENIGIICILTIFLSLIWMVIINITSNSKAKQKNNKKLEDDSDSILENNDNKKIITIIEDLDKLTIDKMIETLDEIKFLSKDKNCIFIVPFDDSILKRALNIKKSIKLDGNYRAVKNENIIDKIFQFKVYVPPFLSVDMKKYAIDVVQENMPNFVAEYCEIETLEKVINNILIHKSVTTPRHAKNILNAFIHNKILVTNKVKSGALDENILNDSEFDYKLAKISVLQVDFKDFYDIVFNNFDYMNTILEIYNSNIKFNDIDDDLKMFFKPITNKDLLNTEENTKYIEIKPEYKSLINFLRRTKKYQIATIAQLIFEDDKYDNSFKEIVLSWDKEAIEDIFNKLTNLSKFSENKKSYNRETAVFDIMCVDDNEEYITKYVQNIIENFIKNQTNKQYVIFVNNIFDIASKYISEQQFEEFLQIVINNYENYPNEAIIIFKTLKNNITDNIVNILFEKVKNNVSSEIFDDVFDILRENSEIFYEKNSNLSDYVQFLVTNIAISSNPDEIINELSENFSRIGRIYELNKNIQNLNNIDNNKALKFIAKCLDNGSLDRMAIDINKIISDENTIENCLEIESKMKKYSLIDCIEYNIENIELLNNGILLKNLLHICAIKQDEIEATDVNKILERIVMYITDLHKLDTSISEQYILDISEILNIFDRMYFYEIRRDFNEILYNCFIITNNDDIKNSITEIAKYFKITRLFNNKLNSIK